MKKQIYLIFLILTILTMVSCVKIEPQKIVAAEYQKGQMHFHRVCATCHGADVAGGTKAPKLIQEKYSQINFPNRKIKWTILNGSTSGAMRSQKGKVSKEQIKEIIKYIRHVQKESGLT